MNNTTRGERKIRTRGTHRLLFVVVWGSTALLQAQEAPPQGPTGETKPPVGDTQPETPKPEEQTPPPDPNELMQLSFQGVEMPQVVKWIAETTGKHIIQDNKAKCKLQIASSRKIPRREALQLVYRALALENVSVIETEDVVLIVPEAKQTQVQIFPSVRNGDATREFSGKEVGMQVFPLNYIQAETIRDKFKSLLSKIGKLDVDTRANRIIVTDYGDNLRLVRDLLKELDVSTVRDAIIEIFPLKYLDATATASLVSRLYAATAGNSGGDASGGGSSRGGSSRGGSSRGGPPPSGAPPAAGGGASNVRIFPDRAANRLVVTAPQEEMSRIRSLIERLDTQKPADVAVRVLQLKHVGAKDLVEEIGRLYEKMSGDSHQDIIEVTANARSNSLIVLSSEANYEDIKGLVDSLDTQEAQKTTLKVFTLKHASAGEMVDQLTDLYDDSSGSGYRGYYYYYSRRNGEQDVKPRFVADGRRNAVMAIAPPNAIDGIADMIKRLDIPLATDDMVPRIYKLRYVSAYDVKELLDELFLKKSTDDSFRRWWNNDDTDTEERDVGRLFGKVRFASELYTNTLIVSAASEENFAAVEDILRQLDIPAESGDSTLHVPLDFANATEVANSVNVLFARGGSPPAQRQAQQQQQQRGQNQNQGQDNLINQDGSFEIEEEVRETAYFPWLGGQAENYRRTDGTVIRPVSDLVGKVRVVPYERTNSLLITTNTHFFSQVLKVINDLDVPTPQVLLEAKIVEVVRDDSTRFGVRWSPDGTQVFDTDDLDDSIQISNFDQYREVFTGSPAVDALRTGIFDASVDIDVLIQLLSKLTDTRVRAEPRLNVADNERGKLFVGARVPFISGSLNTREGGRNDTFRYVDVGIILEVTPHINNHGEVSMSIRVESSQIREGETPFGGFILDTRNYRTDLSVHDGQVLILGGIIQREESEVERKVPFLGDIPLLGWFFKKKDTVARDVELMVFLRPTVTRSREDIERMMGEERKRTKQIDRWEKELEEEAKARKAEEEAAVKD